MSPLCWPHELNHGYKSAERLREDRKAGLNLPVEVGRLAEAAGEEKSAKPPMRSELPPGWMDTR